MKQVNVAIYKLNDAQEKLDILFQNVENLDARSILELASTIRDNVCNDKEIKDGCNSDEKIALIRKSLLDNIRSMQVNIITEKTHREDTDAISSDDVVKNFDEAKASLSIMVDDELAEEMFTETEEPKIFENINECKTHITTLKRVSSDCKYGRYKVLIIGDFQSGKSTTLDAICDGRHISAIGDGTATSAVLVSASYAETESINIHWRSKDQFQPVFERVKNYLQDFDWKGFDLDKESNRQELAKAIDGLRHSKDCPSVREGDAKFLMLCDFVLRYYDTAELKEKKVKLQSISDISDITRFPKNGESDWMKSGVKAFSINDTVFIFIDRVECSIPSETLKELNCTVIDSPGLFNSSYDTMVTENAMKDAHAIMYVLPYHKGIGEDVCQSLYTIRDNYKDFHKKLFIVNNLRSTDNNDFFYSNCEQVRSMFKSNKQVYRYDAKLSYLAQLKKSYLLRVLTIKDYAHLMHVSKKIFSGKIKYVSFDNFEDTWNYHMRKYGQDLELDINCEADEILRDSGFENMIKSLKNFIAENKAYAVIISNGIAPMTFELKTIKNSLETLFMEPYTSSYDDLVERWRNRIQQAEQFQTFMSGFVNSELFDDNGAGALCDRITNEESSKLFTSDFYQNLAEEISGVLYDNKGTLLCTKALFKRDKDLFKQRFTELATPWIQEKIVELVNRKIAYLYSLIESDQDITVQNLFTPVVEKVEERLKSQWHQQFKDDESFKMQDYLVIPNTLNVTKSEETDQSSYRTDALSSNMVDLTLFGGLVAQLSVTVAGIAAMIAGYITAILCDITGTSFLIAVLLGIGGTIIAVMAPSAVRNKFISMLSKQITPKISSGAAIGFKEIVKKHITNALNKYVGNLNLNIKKMKNERDLALTPNPDQEEYCFKAVEAIVEINNHLEKTYAEFKQKNIQPKTN